jgi:GxxExxY protein
MGADGHGYGRVVMGSLVHEELSREIIGAAMLVLNDLKPGLDEKLYENALVIELRERGHEVDQQKRIPVHFKGHLIGTLIPDMIVNELIVVDPKVVTAFNENHMAQMMGYLAKTRLDLALLLNFKFAKLKWKRVVRSAVLSNSHYPCSSAPISGQGELASTDRRTL